MTPYFPRYPSQHLHGGFDRKEFLRLTFPIGLKLFLGGLPGLHLLVGLPFEVPYRILIRASLILDCLVFLFEPLPSLLPGPRENYVDMKLKDKSYPMTK